MERAPVVANHRRGALGVDLNPDCPAVAETESLGTYVSSYRVPQAAYCKSNDQAETSIGDVVAVVSYAGEAGTA